MKKYISYFRLNFIKELQYRAAALAGLSTQFFFGFIFISVYKAFFESGTADVSMTFKQTTSYLWLNQAFLALIMVFSVEKDIMNLVRNGNISYELSRPQNLYFMWYAKIIGQRFSKVLLRFIPLVAVTLFLPEPYNLSLPESGLAFFLFVITLLLGSLLVTTIIVMYPIITLKTLNEKGILPLCLAVADLFSGGSVPIPYFPKFLQIISKYLPFQYVSDLPFRIYSGNIIPSEVLTSIIFQIVWIIILVILGNILLNKSIKRVVIQGG